MHAFTAHIANALSPDRPPDFEDCLHKPSLQRNNASEYYDTTDPFIDDSELAQDERTFFAQTKQKGFYVSSGQVALLNKYVLLPLTAQHPSSSYMAYVREHLRARACIYACRCARICLPPRAKTSCHTAWNALDWSPLVFVDALKNARTLTSRVFAARTE